MGVFSCEPIFSKKNKTAPIKTKLWLFWLLFIVHKTAFYLNLCKNFYQKLVDFQILSEGSPTRQLKYKFMQ